MNLSKSSRIRIVVKKKNLMSSIRNAQAVLRAWYKSDENTDKKIACILRSDNNDLVLEVGFDSVNKSDTIYTSVVERNVCHGNFISSMMMHNELDSAVDKCESTVEITGSSNDDDGPLYFNEYKVRRTGVNPWKLDDSFGSSVTIKTRNLISIASKLWHGFDTFLLESNLGAVKLYAHGVPKAYDYPEATGMGFLSSLKAQSYTGADFVMTGSVKALKAICQASRDIDSDSVVEISRKGMRIKWDGDNSRVITTGVSNFGPVKIVSDKLDRFGTNIPQSYFIRGQLVNCMRFFSEFEDDCNTKSCTTCLGSRVDGRVKSVSGPEMVLSSFGYMVSFVREDYTTGEVKQYASIDSNMLEFSLMSLSSDIIGVASFEDYCIITDGGDKILVSGVSDIPTPHMVNNKYLKRFVI